MGLSLSDSSWIEHPGTTCIQRVVGTTIWSPGATITMAIGMRLGLYQPKPHERIGEYGDQMVQLELVTCTFSASSLLDTWLHVPRVLQGRREVAFKVMLCV